MTSQSCDDVIITGNGNLCAFNINLINKERFNKERFNFNTITNNQYILYFTNVHGLHRVWLFINEMLAFVYSYCTII